MIASGCIGCCSTMTSSKCFAAAVVGRHSSRIFVCWLARAFRDHVSKVIYLDADLLIRRDISEIWEQDMHGKIVLAVQDSYIQRLPALCLPPREQAELERPYFNSGVMVIDLEAWRAAGIEQGCLEAARRLRHRTRWLDQDVLNTCLAGRWGRCRRSGTSSFRWNCFRTGGAAPTRRKSSIRRAANRQSFTSARRTKPWHTFCDHPPRRFSLIVPRSEGLLSRTSWRRNRRFSGGPSSSSPLPIGVSSTRCRRRPGQKTKTCAQGDAAGHVETGDSASLDTLDRAALGCPRASRMRLA